MEHAGFGQQSREVLVIAGHWCRSGLVKGMDARPGKQMARTVPPWSAIAFRLYSGTDLRGATNG